MTYKEKLSAVRSQMKANGIAAYIIPSSDPHISEYVPDRYKCIAFASGFTGSAGTLVITEDTAGLWTDFRYFVQAGEELAHSGFELVKLKVQHAPEYIAWLNEHLPANSVVAFDDRLLSVFLGQLMQNQFAGKNIQLKSYDLLGPIWDNRPILPAEPAFLLSAENTGQSVSDKLKTLRGKMKAVNADHHLVSSLDDIAWLFNIRGKDVSFNPVVLAFALIGVDEATLFVDLTKITGEDKNKLEAEGVKIENYLAVEQRLQEITEDSVVLIDPKKNCFGLFNLLPARVSVVQDINPTTHLKAIKNQTEIALVREAMIKDGVAMTRFFKWIEENLGKIKITELSAAKKLEKFRAAQEGFAGVSFETIGGYQAHGALPHYHASAESDSEIALQGLFLVDSGGQYFYGTTDITRMVVAGEVTEEQSTDYTLVLKAMIEGSSTIYPKGTCGYQIDAICRKPLWEHGINYGHGTGHGIGFYLNVHEGPQVINPTNVAVSLDPGMITSIEPGIYRPGKHGVRIENLVLTVTNITNEFNEFYAFETLTLAAIDTSLVNKDLLEKKHINWLNAYHQLVFDKLSPKLTAQEATWLKAKTEAI